MICYPPPTVNLSKTFVTEVLKMATYVHREGEGVSLPKATEAFYLTKISLLSPPSFPFQVSRLRDLCEPPGQISKSQNRYIVLKHST